MAVQMVEYYQFSCHSAEPQKKVQLIPLLLTVTGTYPQVGTQVKKNITTNPCKWGFIMIKKVGLGQK